jgi:hypothetical protein
MKCYEIGEEKGRERMREVIEKEVDVLGRI